MIKICWAKNCPNKTEDFEDSILCKKHRRATDRGLYVELKEKHLKDYDNKTRKTYL